MKKDIYIIKNDINDKVYIGQAKDAAERWLGHIYNAKYEQKSGKDIQIIHRAMSKYGIQHFHYEVLEYQIENYDEREIYWINKLNSTVPNGYNMATGGKGIGCDISSPKSVFKSDEDLNKCISEISSTTKSFHNIALKFGCSDEVIIAINKGKRYRRDNLVYPLRSDTYRYSNEKVKQILYSLKYEPELTYNDICRRYNIDFSQLCLINKGAIYFIASEDYPLRKKRLKDLSHDVVNLIVEDIRTSNMSMKDIAKKYKITNGRLTSINNGKSYFCDDIDYPIRPENDVRNKSTKRYFSDDELQKIIDLLKTEISIREIAERYNTSDATIRNINNGSCKRYIFKDTEYPIRKLKR